MDIKYTTHAVERMIERKISPNDVFLILSEPDGKIQQSQDKWIYYKKIMYRKDSLIAAVIVERGNESWEIITIMIHFEVKK